MNDYGKIRITPERERRISPNNNYKGIRVTAERERAPKFDPLGDISSMHDLTRKSLLQGVLAATVDSPANIMHLAERGGRKALGFLREQAGKPNNIDQGAENDFFAPENVDRPSKWLNAGANKLGIDLTPRPKNASERIASNAAEFAGSFGPLGLVGKGASLLNAAKLAGTGATIGGASGALQEGGVDPLVADLASTIIAPSMAAKLNPRNLLNNFKKIPETVAKVPLKLMGLSPKSLNIEAASAARDLGIDLPAAALTESKLTGLADQFVGKTPYFGNKLGEKYLNAENQTKDALNKIYENVGPSRTPEIESKIINLFEKSTSLVPEGAAIKPTHLSNALDTIEKKINETAILSPSREKLKTIIETIKNNIDPQLKGVSPNIISQFGLTKMPLRDYDIKKLIGTKTNLNEIIKWDEVKGVKNLLKKAQKATAKDLEEYGKTNPEWYKTFKEADDLFGRVAQREKLERSLSGKSINSATDSISYNALSKAINSPEKNALIKKQVDPETFEKIQKLGTVVRAMAVKNRNVPNPSGTASTNTILGYLGYFYTPQAVTGLIGTAAATKLLTDKKLLDLALKYAEKPNTITAMPFNKRMKEITGYSAIALNKALQREQQDAMGDEE